MKLPGECVVHCFRHTYGTRLGESGADAFTIMRLMGHSSVRVSRRYVHPTPIALERAVDRPEALNGKATQSLSAAPGMLRAPVFSPASGGSVSVSC